MPEHIQYEDDDLFNPGTHHEQSDVPVRPLWWAVAIFIVFAVISHFVLWFLYKAFVVSERDRAEKPQTELTRPASADVPQGQPLLQPFPLAGENGDPIPPPMNTPVTDLEHMRSGEQKVLGSYGWVDRQRGVARIPIEEAKKRLVAQMAVAAQTASTAPAAATATAPEAAAEEQP
jgi:hypothetical protein